jgi:hypothetical protein
MTRARHAMHLVTDSKAALREKVCTKADRLSPSEIDRTMDPHVREAIRREAIRRQRQKKIDRGIEI